MSYSQGEEWKKQVKSQSCQFSASEQERGQLVIIDSKTNAFYFNILTSQ